MKRSSAILINDSKWVKGRFNWQPGFGAFSYSRSALDAVIRYIQNQDRHHGKKSFKSESFTASVSAIIEYLALPTKFDIAFDPRYVFDFPDDEVMNAGVE